MAMPRERSRSRDDSRETRSQTCNGVGAAAAEGGHDSAGTASALTSGDATVVQGSPETIADSDEEREVRLSVLKEQLKPLRMKMKGAEPEQSAEENAEKSAESTSSTTIAAPVNPVDIATSSTCNLDSIQDTDTSLVGTAAATPIDHVQGNATSSSNDGAEGSRSADSACRDEDARHAADGAASGIDQTVADAVSGADEIVATPAPAEVRDDCFARVAASMRKGKGRGKANAVSSSSSITTNHAEGSNTDTSRGEVAVAADPEGTSAGQAEILRISTEPSTLTFTSSEMKEGVICWHDRGYKYYNLPEELHGATLFQGPHASIPKGTIVTLNLPSARAIYVWFENDSKDGGWRSSLPAMGWSLVEASMTWESYHTLSIYRYTAEGTLSLPATETDETIMGIAVQADADEMLQKAAESGKPEELQRAIKAVEQIHKAQEQSMLVESPEASPAAAEDNALDAVQAEQAPTTDAASTSLAPDEESPDAPPMKRARTQEETVSPSASPLASPPPSEEESPSQSSTAPAATGANAVKAQVLDELPVSRLKTIAKFHSISLSGCLEKQDIVRALRSRGINDDEVQKERKLEEDKEKRAREAAEEKEKEKAKDEQKATAKPPPPSSKLPATAGKERKLQDNVARAWGFVIAANNKDKLLNWRPGRREPKPEDDCLGDPADMVPGQAHMGSPGPGAPVPGMPQVVTPAMRAAASVAAAPKRNWGPPRPQQMDQSQILNTHTGVSMATEACWHFLRGHCAKGSRCQWRHPAGVTSY
jgi:hypothetical protein